MGEIDGAFGLKLDLVELFGGQDHVLSRIELKALDDILVGDLALAGHDFEIADPFAALLVDLVKLKPCGARRRRIELDGDRNQRQPQVTFPIRTHGKV